MKIFHSFWAYPLKSKTIPSNTVEIHLYLMALSLLYAKMNGLKISMHTDDFGLKFVDALPYDDIKLSLNEIPEWMPKNMWACGKIFAQKNEELGALHTDYDVFLKSSKCLEKIQNSKYDLIVQSNDSVSTCEQACREIMCKLSEEKIPIYNSKDDYYESYNCGIVGFRNERLKKEYIEKYMELVHRFSTEEKYSDLLHSTITPDLVFEQKLLYYISKPYKVEKLLNSNFFGRELSLEAIRMDYVHLLGHQAKITRINEVIASIKKKDFDLYNKVTNRINLIKKEYNYD